MRNGTRHRQRCQLIVDCISADCPLTQKDDVPSELIERVLTRIASLGLTLDECTLLDRATMEEALWRWLDTVVDQLIEQGSWYVDAPSGNFATLFDRKLADVRPERRRVAATGKGSYAAV